MRKLYFNRALKDLMELMEEMVKKDLKENVVIRVNEGLQVSIIGKHII